jgi:chromosomal replication initiation ATPase DnaA
MTPAETLIAAIAADHGYDAADLCGPSRGHALCRARRLAMIALSEKFGWSNSEIGRLFKRERTTVYQDRHNPIPPKRIEAAKYRPKNRNPFL